MERFRAARQGAVLPVFALMVIFLVVIFGAAADVTRTVSAREKLSYSLDAAALALASELSTSVLTDAQILEVLEASFRANLGGVSFLQEAVDNLQFEVDRENGLVTVRSTATLDNYLIDLGGYMQKSFGPEAFAFSASSQVTYSRFKVELALVVDVTGSMSWSDMRTLREASTAAVNILLPDNVEEEDAKVRISLVPYSQGVNLGAYANKVKGGEFHSVGGNCVTERQDYEDHEVQFTDAAYDYYTDASPPPLQTFFGGGSNNCSSTSEMVPLTRDRDVLLPAIEALTDTGGTAGQTGVAWGWYSLSPNFANVWPEESAPATYTDGDTLKFAIVMTDGNNNRYYDYVGEKEECGWFRSHWSWHWECRTIAVNGWDEQDEGEFYSNISSTRSRALCEGMKAAGIEVFGVYFGTSNSSTGAKNMQSCASEGNYYQASSSGELVKAFANIARKIQSIYLSK